MQTCERSGFFPKNFSCGVTSCTPEVGHLFMRYTAVFAASAQYHFGRFFSFIMARATSTMCRFVRSATLFCWGVWRHENSRQIPSLRRYAVNSSEKYSLPPSIVSSESSDSSLSWLSSLVVISAWAFHSFSALGISIYAGEKSSMKVTDYLHPPIVAFEVVPIRLSGWRWLRLCAVFQVGMPHILGRLSLSRTLANCWLLLSIALPKVSTGWGGRFFGAISRC
mgnify:CR=1 FL=1